MKPALETSGTTEGAIFGNVTVIGDRPAPLGPSTGSKVTKLSGVANVVSSPGRLFPIWVRKS